MNRKPYQIAMILALSCLLWGLGAEEVWHEDENWGLNLPEGWVLMDSRSEIGNLNFSDPAGHAIVQVFQVKGSAVEFAVGLQTNMKVKLATTGRQGFHFGPREAQLSESSWQLGKNAVHGYILAVNELSSGSSDGFVLVAFALEPEFAKYKDALQSVLDSFFVGKDTMYQPGAFSQLSDREKSPAEMARNAQNLAEREARILAEYQNAEYESQKKAWRRFYQQIWKDNYSRLDDVAKTMDGVFKQQKTPRERIPVELLAWVQSFKAETYKTLADLRVPVDAAKQKVGDCDARGLVYMMLLEHLGFSNILMVSAAYQHSMVGLDYQAAGISAGGFTFPVNNKNWMVAEMMAKVPIGQINRDMTDPAKWIGFDLHFIP